MLAQGVMCTDRWGLVNQPSQQTVLDSSGAAPVPLLRRIPFSGGVHDFFSAAAAELVLVSYFAHYFATLVPFGPISWIWAKARIYSDDLKCRLCACVGE
jgi:hypothetical protein